MFSVLVLNTDYTPLEVVAWQEAVALLYLQKVRVVEEYAGRVIRSASTQLGWPAVVARITYTQPRGRFRCSRQNILSRDGYRCQYCGVEPRKPSGVPDLERLTLDHVVPRSKATAGWVKTPWAGKRVKLTSWENLVTACGPCNHQKADLSLDRARLKLHRIPREPTKAEFTWMMIHRYRIPTEWESYLPEASPWRRYWTAELGD